MNEKQDENVTHLNSDEAKEFAEALDEPPKINDRLKRAIDRSHHLIED